MFLFIFYNMLTITEFANLLKNKNPKDRSFYEKDYINRI